MWNTYDDTDLFLVTTNGTLWRDGRLVMGRGITRQAKERFPGLNLALGKHIWRICGSQGTYDLLISPRWPKAKLGAFQVKQHYSQPANLELIHGSTTALRTWCANHPDIQADLNFPGIGHGRLSRTAILPILRQLPDNVTIWEYPQTLPYPTSENTL